MVERPILFQGAMVRALLAGTKTQTRRVVKWRGLEPGLNLQFSGLSVERSGSNFVLSSPTRTSHEYRSVPQPCPYGMPGDRLWVRENGWERPERTPRMMREGADTWEPYYFDADNLSEQEVEDLKGWGFKRRPSIHMPRACSRILLEVTEVRVQRLREINLYDCYEEGIPRPTGPGLGSVVTETDNARGAYRRLWNSINGEGSWDANPWVWAVSFKRIPDVR